MPTPRCWRRAGSSISSSGRNLRAGRYALPVIALRTPQGGEACWILSGIHGEEPAGPNAIAASIDAIAALGERQAVVLLPLNNPHGYVNNWRYLNMQKYSDTRRRGRAWVIPNIC